MLRVEGRVSMKIREAQTLAKKSAEAFDKKYEKMRMKSTASLYFLAS